MNINDQVRVARHWLRGRHIGTLAAYDGTRTNPWLVRFATTWPGGGFTEDGQPGQCLWLDGSQLDPVAPARRSRRKQGTSL